MTNASSTVPTQDELRIHYEFVQMTSEHLSDCWKIFDGDLGEMLVLAVIGQGHLHFLLENKRRIELEGRAFKGFTASRIALITNMPRETVRRKLLCLQKRGFIWEQNKHWRILIEDGRVPAEDALKGLHMRGIQRAKRLTSALKPYVD